MIGLDAAPEGRDALGDEAAGATDGRGAAAGGGEGAAAGGGGDATGRAANGGAADGGAGESGGRTGGIDVPEGAIGLGGMIGTPTGADVIGAPAWKGGDGGEAGAAGGMNGGTAGRTGVCALCAGIPIEGRLNGGEAGVGVPPEGFPPGNPEGRGGNAGVLIGVGVPGGGIAGAGDAFAAGTAGGTA